MPNTSNVTWITWKLVDETPDGEFLYYGEGHCLSGDVKPTKNIYNGSNLLEIDTGKVFVFDAANTLWREL